MSAATAPFTDFGPDDLVYNPEPTIAQFHASTAFVRGIMGPFGSGKTVGCIMELWRIASFQPHSRKGGKRLRRSRFALIRNTYPGLESTTLRTFLDWFGERAQVKYKHPIEAIIRDGDIEAEFLFIALDREEHVDKLKSIEFTAAFINEAVEVPELILKTLRGRVGRYPSKKDGGSVFPCIVMDTNPPDDDHWWYRLAEKKRPHNHKFFRQPPALLRFRRPNGEWAYIPNPKAENVKNQQLGYQYWYNIVEGADDPFIAVYVLAQYGTTAQGKPVFPAWREHLHCATSPLEVFTGRELLSGWDFGGTPAVAFAQQSVTGQLRGVGEVVCPVEKHGIGLDSFVREDVKPYIAERFKNLPLRGWGDPAGTSGGDADALSCFRVLDKRFGHGVIVPCPGGNRLKPRLNAVNRLLTTLVDGEPAMIIDPRMDVLRKGFNGHYIYERVLASGASAEKYKDVPLKNFYSHVQDGWQNLCLGLEARRHGHKPPPPPKKVRAAAWT